MFIPWKEKANKKAIISQFLRKYETDTLRSTDSAFTPPRFYVTSSKKFWVMAAAMIFFFFVASVQIGRFLIKNDLYPCR